MRYSYCEPQRMPSRTLGYPRWSASPRHTKPRSTTNLGTVSLYHHTTPPTPQYGTSGLTATLLLSHFLLFSRVPPARPCCKLQTDAICAQPPREVGRRQSARKSRSQVVALRSPVARVSRRSSGGGFSNSKADNVDGSNGQRPSRRSGGGGSRGSGDHHPPEAGGSAGGGGRDAGRERSHRSSGVRSSSRPSVEHEGRGHGHGQGQGHGLGNGSSSSATVAESARPRPRSSRRREGEGARENGVGGGGGGGGGRSPSSRHERHRQREGDASATATAGRSSPRLSGSGSGSGRRGHRSSRGQEGGNPSGGATGSGTSGRRRESKRQSRGSHEGVRVNGDTVGAVSTPSAPAPTTPVADAAGAAAANGLREAPKSVAKAVRASHEARTPRKGDSLSAHFISHGTPSRTRDERSTPSKPREGRGATTPRSSEGREGGTPTASSAGSQPPREGRTPSASSTVSQPSPKAAREGRTPSASSAGSRPSATAPKQRSGGQDLRPPTW